MMKQLIIEISSLDRMSSTKKLPIAEFFKEGYDLFNKNRLAADEAFRDDSRVKAQIYCNNSLQTNHMTAEICK